MSTAIYELLLLTGFVTPIFFILSLCQFIKNVNKKDQRFYMMLTSLFFWLMTLPYLCKLIWF